MLRCVENRVYRDAVRPWTLFCPTFMTFSLYLSRGAYGPWIEMTVNNVRDTHSTPQIRSIEGARIRSDSSPVWSSRLSSLGYDVDTPSGALSQLGFGCGQFRSG